MPPAVGLHHVMPMFVSEITRAAATEAVCVVGFVTLTWASRSKSPGPTANDCSAHTIVATTAGESTA